MKHLGRILALFTGGVISVLLVHWFYRRAYHALNGRYYTLPQPDGREAG